VFVLRESKAWLNVVMKRIESHHPHVNDLDANVCLHEVLVLVLKDKTARLRVRVSERTYDPGCAWGTKGNEHYAFALTG